MDWHDKHLAGIIKLDGTSTSASVCALFVLKFNHVAISSYGAIFSVRCSFTPSIILTGLALVNATHKDAQLRKAAGAMLPLLLLLLRSFMIFYPTI